MLTSFLTLRVVAGVCLGSQDGRHVSIETTFELLLNEAGTSFDPMYLNAKLEQCM